MAVWEEPQAGDHSFTESERAPLASGNARSWLAGLQSYTRRWVEEHKDCGLRVDEMLEQRGRPDFRLAGCVREAKQCCSWAATRNATTRAQ